MCIFLFCQQKAQHTEIQHAPHTHTTPQPHTTRPESTVHNSPNTPNTPHTTHYSLFSPTPFHTHPRTTTTFILILPRHLPKEDSTNTHAKRRLFQHAQATQHNYTSALSIFSHTTYNIIIQTHNGKD